MSLPLRHAPRLLAAALLGIALVLSARPLDAQYFGRNKVQYRTFDFRVLQTPHFDVYFYPEAEVASRDAARMAERWYARLSRILDHEFEDRQPIVFYGSHPAFQQTTTLSGQIGEGTGGVTEGFKQRVIMPLAGSYQETDHVVGHELVHAFQYDISGLGRSRGSLTAGARAFGTAPLWFVEGMAEYLSVGPVDPHTAMWLRDAVLTGNLPDHDDLSNNPRFFPYRWGQAFWAYVGGRWGDATIGQILALIGQGVPYTEAFDRVLRIDVDDLFEDWHVAIRRAYLPMLAERPEAREVAKPLITPTREGGRLNVGPSISPDGRFVAFLSELSNLDVELWLADAQNGEIVRRLRRGTAFDPHFQSLRYIQSAGAWSPDSRQFAISAQRGAQDVLVIIDVSNADIVREIEVEGVAEITSPTWSPDGRTIVFSGVVGGVSDLYAYDLQSNQSRKLTNDLFAQLHPDFSPDGRSIAFVTDQGPNTDMASLRYDGYRLALMDAAGGEARIVPTTEVGQNINPEWSRDGRSLYFISNRSGIPNVYRVETATGQLFQVTRLFGGVSGITDISPALTVARDADRLLFTAYERSGYNIYALTTAQEMAGTPATGGQFAEGPTGAPGAAGAAGPLPAQLPPVPRPVEAAFNRVATMLRDANTGLVSRETVAGWPVLPYRPRLALDYLGQPQFGVSVGGVAGQGGLYGGISGIFSDVLGYHTVFGTVAAQGEFDEFGFQTLYLNQKHRWNWGVTAQRIPQIWASGGYYGDERGNVRGLRIFRSRFFDTGLQGVAQYPFSRVHRVEFSGGLRRVSQDLQVVDYDYFTGQVERYKADEYSRAWNLLEGSAALVYDNALFGYTSPFAGQRYRFQISPTAGTVQFAQALADYRRYQFLRPFTLAVQGMHFGRYGSNTGDYFRPDSITQANQIFYPIFLGQPSLVRGYYNVYSDCYNGRSTCDQSVLPSLFGNRIALLKAELRFPLIRALVVGPVGFPPVEGFGFFDAGTAWNRGNSVALQRGVPVDPNQRGILTSAGVGARINLLGYVIAEVNYVNAFELNQGWRWQFALQPGF